ncbi:MAG: flagellar export chaperone FliS [Candidatus Aureabacteria bacterium]|nr:flagellar export chaperone FliS [Candidatus Auribacterota bacterium]
MDRPKIPVDDRYLRMKIQTAKPMELILIMYDGAILYLKKALVNYELHKRALYDENLNKAKNVIKELQLSLNLDIKPISGQLFSLYDYMTRQLSDAICNRRENKAKIQHVIRMLQGLRETWNKIKDKAPVEKEKRALENISLSM